MPKSSLKLVASSPAQARPSRQIRGFAGDPFAAPQGGRGRGRRAIQASAQPLPDPIAWRTGFARIWQGFLLSRWGHDPHAVAEAFGVRVQTARNWLDGLHVPTGDVAARAMLVWRPEILAAAVRLGVTDRAG